MGGTFPRDGLLVSGKAWMKAWESSFSLPGFDARALCL